MNFALGSIVYREVNIHHHRSMMALAHEVGPGFSNTIVADTLVSRARSELASWFLRTTADVLLSIDSDIEFTAGDALKVAREAYELGVVGGTYPMRGRADSPQKGAHLLTEEGRHQDHLLEADYLPGGFMAVRKDVFAKIVEESTLPWCQSNASPKHGMYPFYLPLVDDGLYLSEDWSFCKRVREAGFTCWLDPEVRLTHHMTVGYTLD